MKLDGHRLRAALSWFQTTFPWVSAFVKSTARKTFERFKKEFGPDALAIVADLEDVPNMAGLEKRAKAIARLANVVVTRGWSIISEVALAAVVEEAVVALRDALGENVVEPPK